MITRRNFFASSAAALAVAPLLASPASAQQVDVNAILNDPEAPVGGNPKGDVTIVAYLDYNCIYCKKSAPELERVVKEDGNIRVIYKDWPILSKSSVVGAQLALGAKYQGGYETAHNALMNVSGRRASEEDMLKAIQATHLNMKRLQADLDNHGPEITALLQRNLAQAESLGLTGTPTFLVGPFRTGSLDYAGFKQVVADARERQAK
ncbi:DSBA oxidoreductase [Kaistia sp. 32K]|uniref:DsbA family protein n=1 Tax=Kaistia sp. 32K TaxID=2795690 RepID=UPI0019156836|nr:DsbA family protein [Kaistia sp. 32K]BCP51450.1 DSBA oxidoreductase [Kaistia sp. 32K]